MRHLSLLLASSLALAGLSAAANVRVSDFSDPAAWQPNNDGGHAPAVAADPERTARVARVSLSLSHTH